MGMAKGLPQDWMGNMSDEDRRLTVKQKKFVKEVASGNQSLPDAVRAAGYNPSSPKSASNMAAQLLNKPHIANALDREIDRMYPDLERQATELTRGWLEDGGLRPEFKLKVLEFMAKVRGWQAPTKHARVNVDVSKKFKLPEE